MKLLPCLALLVILIWAAAGVPAAGAG